MHRLLLPSWTSTSQSQCHMNEVLSFGSQTDPSALCNAWIFCGDAMGCHNSDLTFGAAGNMCSLYAAADLDYNTPLDKNVGVVRGLGVNFISGKPLTPGPVQGVAASMYSPASCSEQLVSGTNETKRAVSFASSIL